VDPEILSEEKSDTSDLGKELSKLRRVIPTLRRCPKGARREVAESLNQVLTEVLSSNDVVTWGRLLKFPYTALRVPHKSEKVRNLTTFVKSAASNWSAPTLQKTPAPNQWKLPTQSANHSTIKKAEAKLADGDIQGAIRLLSRDDLVAPNTQETVDSLLSKHPCHPQPSFFPTVPETVEVDHISVEETIKAIKSFPSGSAGGLDALRPRILKDLLGSYIVDNEDKLLNSLATFLTRILQGDVPSEIRPILFGASLTVL